MRKIGILLLCAALIPFLFYKLTNVPALPETPGYNVLYLSGDSFNKKHLAIYGYHRDTMPFLSGLAQDAAVFDQMINPSGWTNESLISIFSSLSSPVHKVETRGHSIDPGWITPIEILREYDYRVPRLGGWQGTENHSNLGVLGQAREKRHGIAMIPVDREVLLVEAVCGKIENVVAGSLRQSWDGSEFVEQEREQRCTQQENTYLAHGYTVGFGTISPVTYGL